MIDELEKELNGLIDEMKNGNDSPDVEEVASFYPKITKKQKEAQTLFEKDDKEGDKSLKELLREMRYAEKLWDLTSALEVFNHKLLDPKLVNKDELIDGIASSLDAINSVRHYAPIEVKDE